MRNQVYVANFTFVIFWATFGGKIGVATMQGPDDLWPQNSTK